MVPVSGNAAVLRALQHSRKHHLLLILPRRDLASFLSDFPDSLPLSSMLLPGISIPLRIALYAPLTFVRATFYSGTHDT